MPPRPNPRATGAPTGRGAGDRPARRGEPPRTASRAQAAAYVRPTDPDRLTADDLEEIQILLQVEDREMDRAVNEWVSSADPADAASGARVFFSAEIVERTFRATGRLISATENKFRGVDRRSRKFYDLEAHKNRLAAVRAQTKAIRATMFAEKAAESPKNQARQVLGDLFPVTLTEIRNRIKDGEDPDQVLADLKARGVGESATAVRARGEE